MIGALFPLCSIKACLISPILTVLLLAFILLKALTIDVILFFILISVIGMCLGGVFNTMAGLIAVNMKNISDGCIGAYAAISMSIANITTALTQLLIGFISDKD